jgi:hypothetical protein
LRFAADKLAEPLSTNTRAGLRHDSMCVLFFDSHAYSLPSSLDGEEGSP